MSAGIFLDDSNRREGFIIPEALCQQNGPVVGQANDAVGETHTRGVVPACLKDCLSFHGAVTCCILF